jgi:hypothetical protein
LNTWRRYEAEEDQGGIEVVSTPGLSKAKDESRRARKYGNTKGGGRQRGGDLRSRGRRGRSRYRYRFRRGIGRWWLGDLPSDRRASSSSHMRISSRPCSLLGVFAIPGGSEANCRFEGSPVVVDAHAVLIMPFGSVVPFRQRRGRSTILLSVQCATRPTGIPQAQDSVKWPQWAKRPTGALEVA